MALTLAEAAKLSNDTLLAGVIETMAEESPILQRLPFIEITGNGLTYNRENAAPTAGFWGVGDEWDEDTPTFTQQTACSTLRGRRTGSRTVRLRQSGGHRGRPERPAVLGCTRALPRRPLQ